MDVVLKGILAAAALYFLYRRGMRYLRFFQQEQYNSSRFLKWVWQEQAWDRRGSLAALLGWMLSWLHLSLAGVGALLLVAVLEEDPRVRGKIKLDLTPRARRILRQTLLLGGFGVGIAVLFPGTWLSLLLLFQVLPLVMVGAHLTLLPMELYRQRRFLREAKESLRRVNPFVIGITGSYGKTSTKHALGDVLQLTLGPTFWPSRGVNSLMGITREVRERLKLGYAYAVIEMGAFHEGSIRKLTSLTPPQAAIITAIGTVHLDRFGSADAVYRAKKELVDALPEGGLLVCNRDNAGARQMGEEYQRGPVYFYGFEGDAADHFCHIADFHLGLLGSTFSLDWEGKAYTVFTPLMGRAAAANLAATFTMACALGADPEYVVAVMASMKPVNNRLQLDRSGEAVYLRDAYNSNPQGFRAALETMELLPGKRKILVTPGVIEQGRRQYAENVKLGQMAARCCDLSLVVGSTNRAALMEGLEQGGVTSEQVVLCETRDEALRHLKELEQAGDIVLVENDLPDLYEGGRTW